MKSTSAAKFLLCYEIDLHIVLRVNWRKSQLFATAAEKVISLHVVNNDISLLFRDFRVIRGFHEICGFSEIRGLVSNSFELAY